jgi:hypothetical protein
MAEIKLKSGEIVLIDDEDLEFLKSFDWRLGKNGYALTTIYMHRLLMKTPRHLYTDHKNRNKLDNRKTNLRNVTPSQNSRNRARPKFGYKAGKPLTSQFRGVSKKGDKWRATICMNKKRIHLGCFDTEQKASHIYEAATQKLLEVGS